jgi:cytochrome c
MDNRALSLLIAAGLALGVSTARADDDVKAGAAVFKRTCAVCHTVEAGKNKIGPSLFGVVGRKSGSIDGFKYSEAMKKADLTWSNDTLDKYLTDPKTFVPGNRMTYAGLKKEADRKAVIDYLDTVK